MNELRKRVVEAMLDGEMTSHLGYEAHDPAGSAQATPATAIQPGKSTARMANWNWTSPATETATSSLRLSARASAGLTVLMM